jgi:hypothetical protein
MFRALPYPKIYTVRTTQADRQTDTQTDRKQKVRPSVRVSATKLLSALGGSQTSAGTTLAQAQDTLLK